MGAHTIHRDATPRELSAMRRAFELARRGSADDPNPQVGCVLLSPDARTLAEGWHRGAGSPHAEADALAKARVSATSTRGATAVVTLEPCSHWGRTGPCAEALVKAGITRVVFSVPDPNPVASGGAEYLRSHGVDVVVGALEAEGRELLGRWLASIAAPSHITVKLAATLDGRIAAADGTSQWITGAEARAHAHQVRAGMDALIIGTGTALADNPSLTARKTDGSLQGHQPARVVMGARALPEDAALRGPGGPLVTLASHNPNHVVAALGQRGLTKLLVEGGPTVTSAFLAAGLADEIHAYIAPALLGAGPSAVTKLGITTIADAMRWHTTEVRQLGDDVLLVAQPISSGRSPSEVECNTN
jgi:diaminohydroxyphosphoribosylaminopyrimidine deaminase/5-amino-6-(5-phosphoribosylamino)uracil reductase